MFSLVAPPGGSTEDQISATDGKLQSDLQTIFDTVIKSNCSKKLSLDISLESREKREERKKIRMC